MRAWIPFVFAGALLLLFMVLARRATTVLELRIEEGRIVMQRGRAPGELLHDLSDIFKMGRVTGHLVLRLEDRSVVAHSPDLDGGTMQRIRNVVGRFSAARLKAAPKVKHL